MSKFAYFFILPLFFSCHSLFSHEQDHPQKMISDSYEKSSVLHEEEESLSKNENAKGSNSNNSKDDTIESSTADAPQFDKHRSHFIEDESSLHLLQSSFEEKKINEAIAARYQTAKKTSKEENKNEADKSEKPRETSYLKISGLLFNGPDAWSIWIDGAIYNQHNSTFRTDLTLRALNAQTVELTDHGEKILLFVGQSYNLDTKKVISGG